MLLGENLPFCLSLDNFVEEIIAPHSNKSYFRNEHAKVSRLATNDLNKSASTETIKKRILKKSGI